MFRIDFNRGALDNLAHMRARDRSWVLDEIDLHLRREPLTVTRRRKPLVAFDPPWDALGVTWELRVGDFRVFYDVDDETGVVTVRRVLPKLPHRTTEDSL